MNSNLTWAKIEKLIDILSEKISQKNMSFQSISTISRGGLVPARLLADRLGLEKILVDKKTIPSDSLFVDDIYDTGDVFSRILAKSESPDNLVYSTLFARKGQKFPKQLIYATLTNGNEYVVYPWDRFEYRMMKQF